MIKFIITDELLFTNYIYFKDEFELDMYDSLNELIFKNINLNNKFIYEIDESENIFKVNKKYK